MRQKKRLKKLNKTRLLLILISDIAEAPPPELLKKYLGLAVAVDTKPSKTLPLMFNVLVVVPLL